MCRIPPPLMGSSVLAWLLWYYAGNHGISTGPILVFLIPFTIFVLTLKDNLRSLWKIFKQAWYFSLAYSYICKRIKVSVASADARDEKGTSVEVRDYTRSCEFLNDYAHSQWPLPLWAGRLRSGNKSEDLPLSVSGCFREIRHQGQYSWIHIHRAFCKRYNVNCL